MDFTNLEKIYVVDMINVETDEVVTLCNAYVSLDAAYYFLEECKKMDERTGLIGKWTYRVRSFTLFR